MKTRLLLFFFFVFSFGNAQINVVEGFESGAIPAGWGSIGFSLYNSSPAACNGNFSFYGALSASSTFRQLTTSSYISDGGQINVSFNYKRTIGAFVGIFRIYYEVNGSGTWTEVINTSSFSTSCVPLNGYISTGVIPAGSSVKFRMQINRTSGDTTTFIDDFSAVQTGSLPTGTIAEYNFDNTYNNILGANPFQANANTTFTTDRHGNISGALRIINQGTFATILGLPYNSTSRTISVWAKSNVLNSQINYVFHYGNSANGNGLAFRPTTTLYFANAGANLETADTNTNNTWIHYVCTYDGTTAKVYKNGVLFSSGV
ncbi:hypothetical protein GFJ94_02810, partial [Flavobacterium sp. LMO8]|uniref:LamG domain-containing protein n=1 Tax=Flavobacterium sp. LMO8 TaxID=2654244 RepID=UPI0013967662